MRQFMVGAVGIGKGMRALLVSGAVSALLLAGAARVDAQGLSSVLDSTAGASCSGGGSADGDCRNSAGFSSGPTSTSFTSRYAWNINADTGALSTHDTSGNAQHNVSFNATAPGGYRLDISTSRVGDINRVNDVSGCSGDADTGGVSGSSNIGLNSGTLSLGDPGGLGSSGDDSEIPFSQGSSATIFRVSNGAAQGHTLTFTWSGSVRSNSCEAAVRQGESSGTTTGCSACGYPGNPGRGATGDGHFVTVAFTSLCGNGVVDGSVSEQCDEGGANGTAASCCNANCTFRGSGGVCRSSAGVCDPQEVCSGGSGTCPGDTKSPSGTVCRSSAGVCDVQEVCNGAASTCPGDSFVPNSTVCRSSAGVCDPAENCPGNAAACPSDSKSPSGTVCRSTTGVCDPQEVCNGAANTCPADAKSPSGTVCRSAAGVCDVLEICNGVASTCPADAKSPSGTVCRSSAGLCDAIEVCDGSSVSCPADVKQPSGTVCRETAGVCDVQEVCNGSADACPADGFLSSSTVCRSAAGECDLAEACPGSGPNCPSDSKKPNGTSCTSDGNVCTDDQCNGVGNTCTHPNNTAPCSDGLFCDGADTCSGGSCTVHAGDPCIGGSECADACNESADNCFDLSGTTCTDDGNGCTNDQCNGAGTCAHPNNTAPCVDGVFCNGADTCSGGSCSIHAGDPCVGGAECNAFCNEGASNCFDSAGTACTDEGNPCSTDECDGSGTCAHPAGNAGALCRAAAGVCDVPDFCDGTSTTCPADSVSGAVVVCRSTAGECDQAESCDGVGVDCPADAKVTSGTTCTDDGNICTVDQCDGSSDTCQHPAGNAGTTCRSSAGSCDLAETCDGSSSACPADAVESSSVVCRSSAGVCDIVESCTGSSAACPADTFEPASTVCRSAVDQCDAAESCTGSAAACPADASQPDGTSCVDGDACTAPDTCQAGVCTGTANIGACLDNFNCYKDKITPGTPKFVAIPGVSLVDEYESGSFDVKKPKNMCLPSNKDGSGIVDASIALENYQIKAVIGSPPPTPHTNQVVTNVLGTIHVDTVKPQFLLVPTAKDILTSPPAPNPSGHNVDNFKCYKVRVTRGTPKFPRGIQFVVADDFTSPPKRLDVKAIKYFCPPVILNGAPRKNTARYLMCYKVKPAFGEPLHVPKRVFVHNVLAAERIDTVKEDLFCLPSEKP